MQSGRPRFYKSRFLRRTFLIGLPLLGLGYVAGSLVGLYIFTTSPERKLPVETPASVGLAYETVTFSSAASDQLKLKGWWIPHKKSDRVLILVHVKNGNRAFGLQVARPLWEQGYNLLLFDMRGHGEPEGDHYTYGRYEQFDVVGAANFVQSKGFGPRKIGAIGWSMGAASTLMAMSQTPAIQAAIIDSSYGDLGRVAGQRLGLLSVFYPGLEVAGQLFLNANIEGIKPEAAFNQLGSRHVILIHGDQDTTVPVSEVYHLQKAGGSHITATWVLSGVGHAGAYQAQPTEYLRRVLDFFDHELR